MLTHVSAKLAEQREWWLEHRVAAKEVLSQRDLAIIWMRFGLEDGAHPHSMKEVGQKFNLSIKRVSDICELGRSRTQQNAERLARGDLNVVGPHKISPDRPLSDLRLSSFPQNALTKGGIETINQLCNVRASSLQYLPNMGPTRRAEVRDKLAAVGLSLMP